MFNKLIILTSFVIFPSLAFAEEPQDMSDPMAVYTGGEIIAGNKGLGASFQFGLNKGDWGLLGKVEGTNNFENFRTRLFAPNKKTGTGLFIDAGSDASSDLLTSNYATVGLMQAFPISDKIRLYSGITYGKMWEAKDQFQETQIITSASYLIYDFAEKFYLQLAPQYSYGLDGEEIRDFSAEFQIGYKVDQDNVIVFTGDTDNNAWMTYRTRF